MEGASWALVHSIWNAPSLQGVHGLHEYPGLPVDEAHVLDDLVLGVEQLDALRVRVVARREGARVRSSEFPGKSRQIQSYERGLTASAVLSLITYRAD